MAHRATKSGFAREAQDKVNAKYDDNFASELLQFLKDSTGESFSTDGNMDNLYEVLKDGYILAKAAQVHGANIPQKLVARNKLAFKQMEVIDAFLKAAKGMGVPDAECFETSQLYDRTNLAQVLICIDSFSRKTGKRGVKEATANPRQFTEEQLNESKKTISLQYGTNKGASQAGLNMGKQRMIVD